jgi:hypothetical protein
MAERLSREEITRYVETLDQSQDSNRLAESATALAGSGDREAVIALGRRLRRGEFLSRLDNTADPNLDISNLTLVFRTLATHPADVTGEICVSIYAEPEFREIPARINLLLGALAAVRPVTVQAADVFRATSAEGFAEVNAPLLLENGSPLALQAFEEIITGDWVESYVKVDMLHRAVLPRRARLPVLETCDRLLEHELPAEVKEGLIETLFDYESRLWFGPAMYPPEPPAWDSASTEALEFLLALAARILLAMPEGRLRAPVQSARKELEGILQRRRQ